MSLEGDRLILVRLEPGLHPSRVNALFHAFATYPGVECCFSGGPGAIDYDERQRTLIEGLPLPKPRTKASKPVVT